MIERALRANKFLLLVMIITIVAGIASIISIPKESSPDVTIPTVRVILSQSGASPEDVERMLVLPVEREISGISGINRLRAWVFEGRATIRADFDMGTDMREAIDSIKDAVDRAKSSFPSEAGEPFVSEDNPALYPVMAIGVSGPNDQRETVLQASRELKQKLERVHNVFEVDMVGDIDDVIEVTLSMRDILAIGLTPLQISSRINANNRLINSGDVILDGESVNISVPGMIDSERAISSLPIAIIDRAIITLGDIAEINVTHRERSSSSFINGRSAITLNVSKNIGSSTVTVAGDIHNTLNEVSLPDGVTLQVMDDQSIEVISMLQNLSVSVIMTICIVMIVLGIMLSISGSLMVGATIPLSFLMAFSSLYFMGYTANSVVLFGLILVTGMLVDSAIVVSEAADKARESGLSQHHAYLESAKRMASPIIASLLTTIMAFSPMLFWPGTTGEFMKYLPLTVILALLASLVASLVFMPALSSMFSAKSKQKKTAPPSWYRSTVFFCARYPQVVLTLAFVASSSVAVSYYFLNKGVVFFPEGEAENITVRVFKEGSHPLEVMEGHIHHVESLLTGVEGIERINSSVRESSFSDMIGSVNMSLVDWRNRPDADSIIQDVRNAIGDLSPLSYEIQTRRGGPRGGKPIAITLSHERPDRLNDATNALMSFMESDRVATLDVTTERKTPGPQWDIVIDRGLADFYGIDLAEAGAMINMATRGARLTTLVLPGFDDEVDVIVRLPEEERTPYGIINMQIPSDQGAVPLRAFSEVESVSKLSVIRRSDQQRTMRIEASIEDGILASEVIQYLRESMDEILAPYPGVHYQFRGEAADSEETQYFLYMAFMTALGLMLAVLLLQFNSWSQSGIIFLAIAFSVIGVLLTLLILRQPFGVVFSGLAILSLSGISINHNIILIDEFNHFKQLGYCNRKAAIFSALSRFRPILMTVLTTSLGLAPMMLEISFDISEMAITFGDPSMRTWSQLSSNIVGGLAFSAMASLAVTPALLSLTRHQGSIDNPVKIK